MKRALRPGLGDVPTSGTEQKGASGSEKKKKKQKRLQDWLHLRGICYSHQTVSTLVFHT